MAVTATLAAVLLAAAALALLGLTTVVPLVVASGLAERRGYGSARWAAVSAACSLAGLGVAAVAVRAGYGPGAAAVGLAATWAAPLALVLLGDVRRTSGAGRGAARWAGRRGRHE